MANEAGAGCTNRNNALTTYTAVSKIAASIGGNVSRLAFFGGSGVYTSAMAFAFFTASGADLTTVAGTIVTGLTAPIAADTCHEFSAPGDFSEFAVSAGNYLGCYTYRAQDRNTSDGTGLWYTSGDHTNAAAYTFTSNDAYGDALTADITAGEGGTTYDETCADGFSLGDSAGAATQFNCTCTDGLDMGDTPSSVATINGALSDGFALGDAAAVACTFNGQCVDGLTLGETLVAVCTMVATLSDGLTLGDSATAGNMFNESITDGMVLSDAAAALIDMVVSASDGLTLGDSAVAIATFNVTCSDGMKFVETLSAVVNFVIALSDSFTLGDISVSTTSGAGAIVTFTCNARRFEFIVSKTDYTFDAKTKNWIFYSKN